MPRNPPQGMQRIIPYLSYADAPAAIAFLCKAFGFEERFRYPMPDGRIGHAELGYQDNVVMLASAYEGFGESPLRLPAVHAQVYCFVDDVDSHFARARHEPAPARAAPHQPGRGGQPGGRCAGARLPPPSRAIRRPARLARRGGGVLGRATRRIQGARGAQAEAGVKPEFARVTTLVEVDPAEAFEVFTREIDAWWKRGPRYRFASGALRFEGRVVKIDERRAPHSCWPRSQAATASVRLRS